MSYVYITRALDAHKEYWPVRLTSSVIMSYFCEMDIVNQFRTGTRLSCKHKYFETIQLHLWIHYFPLIMQGKNFP